MQTKLPRIALVTPFVAALWLGGCGFGKVADCNKLIQAANAQSQAIRDSTTRLSASATPADIDALAATFDKAGTEVSALSLKDAKLTSFQKDYKDMMTRAAKSCRDMSAAIRAKNISQINKAKGELDSVGGNETKVVTEINGYCTGG